MKNKVNVINKHYLLGVSIWVYHSIPSKTLRKWLQSDFVSDSIGIIKSLHRRLYRKTLENNLQILISKKNDILLI
jgi:hypothetical protein